VVQGSASPYFLLAAIAWCMATGGGTGVRDLTIVGVLLVAAFLAAGGLADIRPHAVPALWTATLLLLLAWLITNGPLRWGLSLDTVRVPILVLAALITIRTVSLLDETQRARVLNGLVVLGTVHGSIAIAEIIWGFASGDLATPLPRAESLLGNPNALGIVLVTTAVLTARELQRRLTPLLGAALAVQSIALLLTGSRLAILTALCVLGWYWMTQATWKTSMLLMPWVVLAVLVLALRFVQSLPDQRLLLWVAAAERIALSPITGHGPSAEVYDLPLADARPTTHAHNELLQFAVEYGFIGLVLATGTLILALRHLHRRWPGDRWLMVAAASLLAGGLTDFTLRITAITITSAALSAAALSGASPPVGASSAAARAAQPLRARPEVALQIGMCPKNEDHDAPHMRPRC
jgi:O-antigen ligase